MSFDDDFEKSQEEMASQNRSTSDFYKFHIGDHIMRIMSSPVKKMSRFGYGTCYPGASYCDPDVMEAEFQKKMDAYGEEFEKARKGGATEKELKMIKKPSRSNISVKWSVWAIVRRTVAKNRQTGKQEVHEVNELKIVDLTNGLAESLYNLKKDKDMGTNFEEFPMPYDVKISVTQKKTRGTPTPKDIEYALVPGQQRKDVTAVEMADMEKKTPVQQIIERMQEKARDQAEGGASDDSEETHSGGIEYPKDDINPDDIPF